MSDLSVLKRRNETYSGSFMSADLPAKPRFATLILSCMDARVDPAHVFGLDAGDAVVLRNAGGRVDPSVIRDAAIFGFLSSMSPGEPVTPQLVIVQHTNCGMVKFADPVAQKALAERIGVSQDKIAALAISDPYDSARHDVEIARNDPAMPKNLVVSGFVYDVSTGELAEVGTP